MKARLLDVAVTQMERSVLLDMAAAVREGSTVYSWGHDRLALAIGKRPRTPAAKQALSGRIMPSLIGKGLVTKTASAHPDRNAEYELLILSKMGNGQPVDNSGMGNGSEREWVTVQSGMGNAQTVTPPPFSTLNPPTRASAHGGMDSDEPARIAAMAESERQSAGFPRTAHNHEPNAARSLDRLRQEHRLAVGLDDLLRLAYEIAGDKGPYYGGYQSIRHSIEQRPLEGVRDELATLRSRMIRKAVA